VRAAGYDMQALRYLAGAGREAACLTAATFHRELGERFTSLPRGELAAAIYERVAGDVETRFGDSIARLDDGPGGVDVTFASGLQRRFDLVIGCDGAHSALRAQLFGASAAATDYLGYVAASFITDGYPARDEHTYVSWAAPGKQISRYALRDDRSAFLLVWTRAQPPVLAAGDRGGRVRLTADAFAGDDWCELPAIRERLAASAELYFDSVAQVHAPAWSRGRVALLGDAAYCPSLLAGAGSSYAMAGAYLLAGELARAGGDHVVGFAAYERRFRPFIDAKQRAARRFASSFAPRTAFGLWARDAALRLMNVPHLGDWMLRRMVADRFPLPDYDA
jgi:2-polyprenyl-6-methoxyphenol hydroxylase-like FAD-dependent oxidoreductase